MSLEAVKEEITRKASQEAKAIQKDAEKERDAILESARKKAETIKKERAESLKEDIALLEKKADASNDLDRKKAVLTEKKLQIDETFAEALDRLEKTPKSEMKKRLNTLIDRAGEEIDVGMVFCNKRDKDMIEGKTTAKGIAGGVIAEDNEGMVSVDLCFETLLEEYKEKNIEDISQMLFT